MATASLTIRQPEFTLNLSPDLQVKQFQATNGNAITAWHDFIQRQKTLVGAGNTFPFLYSLVDDVLDDVPDLDPHNPEDQGEFGTWAFPFHLLDFIWEQEAHSYGGESILFHPHGMYADSDNIQGYMQCPTGERFTGATVYPLWWTGGPVTNDGIAVYYGMVANLSQLGNSGLYLDYLDQLSGLNEQGAGATEALVQHQRFTWVSRSKVLLPPVLAIEDEPEFWESMDMLPLPMRGAGMASNVGLWRDQGAGLELPFTVQS